MCALQGAYQYFKIRILLALAGQTNKNFQVTMYIFGKSLQIPFTDSDTNFAYRFHTVLTFSVTLRG
jgi:hypothetical protein